VLELFFILSKALHYFITETDNLLQGLNKALKFCLVKRIFVYNIMKPSQVKNRTFTITFTIDKYLFNVINLNLV
jgi:hypothetical protein